MLASLVNHSSFSAIVDTLGAFFATSKTIARSHIDTNWLLCRSQASRVLLATSNGTSLFVPPTASGKQLKIAMHSCLHRQTFDKRPIDVLSWF